MTDRRPPTVDDVVLAVEEELTHRAVSRSTPAGEPADAVRVALDLARALQGEFRAEPVGGRLVPLKRFVHWFVASSFDRQAKVVEALLPALESLRAEVVALRREVADLRKGEGGGPPPAGR